MLPVRPGSYLDGLFRAHQIPFPAHPRYSAGDIVRLDDNRRAADRLAGAHGDPPPVAEPARQAQAVTAARPKAGIGPKLVATARRAVLQLSRRIGGAS
ncbi:MAG: hypothetical protein WDN49_27575 [Acetobacteraceae bacterium]